MKIPEIISSSDLPRSEAEILLAEVLQKKREWLLAHSEEEIDNEKIQTFKKIVGRRKAGEPVAYILGRQEFFGLDFYVDSRVLVPRPETELIAEEILKIAPKSLCDVGTGSGAIAISVAKNLHDCRVMAVDISADALAVARENAFRHEVEIDFRESDLLTEISGDFEIFVANLPYISESSEELEENVAKFEPALALTSGSDGLDSIRRLLTQISKLEKNPRAVLLEIGFDQAKLLIDFVREIFPTAEIEILKDLAGHDRVAKIFFK